MSYTPTTWSTGDVITAEKLNNTEKGIGDGGLPKNIPEKILMADGIFEFELDEGLYKNASDINAPRIDVGEEYSITWDGVEYNFVGEYPLQPGSQEIADGQTGEYPFYFFTDMGIFCCMTLDNSPTHTIKIEKSTTSIKPGTAMVFDGNEWIQQEGYAYIEKTHEDIVWEGDTNGRDSFDIEGITAYKISDLVPEPSNLIGCAFTANGQTATLTSDMINSDTPGVIMIGEGGVMVFSETSISSGGMTITVPSTGIYSLMPCTLSFPKTIHKFDSELIESSGQNNVEFVKLATLNLQQSAETPESGTGGPLQDGKTIAEFVGGKNVIGITSMYRYDASGGNSEYLAKAVPVLTQLTSMGYPIGLWELQDHMNDTAISVLVKWGYLFASYSSVSTYHGELDIYAICI